MRVDKLRENSLGVVDPEEVGVQDRLNDAAQHRNWIPIAALCEESPDPVGDVKCSVGAERKEIMRRDRFGFTSPLQHEELWEDRNGLEPDRECPKHLHTTSVGAKEYSLPSRSL
jgi:hypothetical protein